MSHVTKINLKIRDVDALREAAEACGLEMRENQKSYAWWGTFVGDSSEYGDHDPRTFGKCEHALREPGTDPKNGSRGPWEIGIVKAKDGDGYDVLYDRFGQPGTKLESFVGQRAERLRREYAAAVARRKASQHLTRKGFVTTRENLPGNRIRLRLRKR